MAGGELGQDGGYLALGGRARPLLGWQTLVAASGEGSKPTQLRQKFEVVAQATVNCGKGAFLQLVLNGFWVEAG